MNGNTSETQRLVKDYSGELEQKNFHCRRWLNQERFLGAYSECASIVRASRCAQINRTTHYVWMREDPTYPARFKDAQERAASNLRDEAVRRAVHGIRKPVLYKGKPVRVNGKILYQVEYSARLLIRLMEICDPQRYGR